MTIKNSFKILLGVWMNYNNYLNQILKNSFTDREGWFLIILSQLGYVIVSMFHVWEFVLVIANLNNRSALQNQKKYSCNYNRHMVLDNVSSANEYSLNTLSSNSFNTSRQLAIAQSCSYTTFLPPSFVPELNRLVEICVAIQVQIPTNRKYPVPIEILQKHSGVRLCVCVCVISMYDVFFVASQSTRELVLVKYCLSAWAVCQSTRT